MICNNCIHKQLCNEWEKRTEYVKPVSNGVCDHYANATEMIKLPCKLGDTVYWVSRFNGGISHGVVNGILISGFGFDLKIIDATSMVITRELEKVFLTEAEAKAKHAELEGIGE